MNPVHWRKFALGNVGFFIVLWIVSEFTGWVQDPAFISRLSLAALILAALSWWQSTRVEVKQYEDADVADVLAWLKENVGPRGD